MSGPLRLQVPYLNKVFIHIHFHIWQDIISYVPEILFRCNSILLDSRFPQPEPSIQTSRHPLYLATDIAPTKGRRHRISQP